MLGSQAITLRRGESRALEAAEHGLLYDLLLGGEEPLPQSRQGPVRRSAEFVMPRAEARRGLAW
jgi:hypothetical protein